MSTRRCLLRSARMLANAGYPVLELRRERFGRVRLGDLGEAQYVPVQGSGLEWASEVLGYSDDI